MISVIIPAYNEEGNLRLVTKRIAEVIKNKIKEKYELIIIDDGSTDNSLNILVDLKKTNKNIKIISFGKNLGQTAALKRGFEEAKGEIAVTLDADLQNFPEDIPKLIKKLNEGYDAVCGWREKREDKLFSKKIPSIVGNKLIRGITGLKIHDIGCTLRAYKKESIKNLALFGDMHRYIPLILAKKGLKLGEIRVRHAKRYSGKTKYGPKRFTRAFLDLIFIQLFWKYSKKPFHLFALFGSLCLFTGFILFISDITFLLFFLHITLLKINIGPILFISVLLMLFGLNFIVLGMISESVFSQSNNEIKEKIY